MAFVQVEAPGQLQEFLKVLRKRRWQTLLPFGLILTLGVCFATIVPRKYIVTTQVELRENRFDAGDRRNVTASTTLREAENAPYQIKALARIRSVVDQLKGWTDYMALSPQDRHEYLLELQDNIDVTMPRRLKTQGSTFVTISFQHTDARRAFEFLRGLRTAWIEQEVERDRNRLAAEFQGLLREKGELQKEVAAEERDFAQLRSDYNISPTQPSPSANQVRMEDPVFERLNDHETELAGARITEGTLDASAEAIRTQLEALPSQLLEQTIVEGVGFGEEVADLRRSLAVMRAEFASYGRQHSRYRSLQDDIVEAEGQLDEVQRRETRGEVHENWVDNPVYLSLKQLLGETELELKGIQARIFHLENTLAQEREEVEERQDVYRQVREKTAGIARLVMVLDELEGRLQYKKQVMDIMNGPTGNPFQITQEVVIPKKATEPDPWLIVAVSIVLGMAVGLGGSMFSEYSKNCFRGAGDISGVMIVPVLGIVNQIRTRGALRRMQVRRTLVGTSTLMIMGSFLFVTWAWGWSPELLSDGVMESIEVFRGWFR
jgi:uncharacterized protein involved in exopolysaccharide biosynthesis